MDMRAWGLVVFVLVVGLNTTGLVLDAALYVGGYPTVTEYARRNYLVAALIECVNVVGFAGLVVHFFPRLPE